MRSRLLPGALTCVKHTIFIISDRSNLEAKKQSKQAKPSSYKGTVIVPIQLDLQLIPNVEARQPEYVLLNGCN